MIDSTELKALVKYYGAIDTDEGLRRAGNTTRLIDKAIQELFTYGFTFVVDHYPTEQANKNLLDRISKRLAIEHPRVKFIVGSKDGKKIIQLTK